MRAGSRIAFLILITVWAGIIIGISLIATPIKFQAPSLTMQTGLEIGQYTLRLLSRIEICFLIAAIATAGIAQPRRFTAIALAAIVVALALQRYWLLPDLDNRVSQILAGGAPSFSIEHAIYAVLEGVKATLLIISAVVECRSQQLG